MTTKGENESFVNHLEELRSRLLKSFLFLIIVFIICYFFLKIYTTFY